MITFLNKDYIPYSSRYMYYKMKLYRMPIEFKISRKTKIKYLIKNTL